MDRCNPAAPIVYVIDDDPDLRDSLVMLLESVGVAAQGFLSANALLDAAVLDRPRPACLLLDVQLPGISGIALLEYLRAREVRLPAIMITGHGDVPTAVRAMKLGAVDFLTKPINHRQLIDLVQKCLSAQTGARARAREPEALLERYRQLTPREREVFMRVTAGQSNKQIATDLGISIRTIETHRAQTMRKMRLRNLAELIHARFELEPLLATGRTPTGQN